MDNMAVKVRGGWLYKGSVTLVNLGSATLPMSIVLNQFSINQIFVRINSTFNRRVDSRAGGRVQSVHCTVKTGCKWCRHHKMALLMIKIQLVALRVNSNSRDVI